MNYMITYKKINGDIFIRNRKTLYNMHVGDKTSMGWEIINIHYLYEGNYYTYDDYRRIVRHKQMKKKKKHLILKYLIRQLSKHV